jgi:hypothetical protein
VTSKDSVMLSNLKDSFIEISTPKNSLTNIYAVEVRSLLCVELFSLTTFDCKKIKKITLGSNNRIKTPYGFCRIANDPSSSICHIITKCLRVE